MSGLVRDAGSGDPIVAASVVYDDMIIAVTDESGSYVAPNLADRGSTIVLVFRRIGFTASAREVQVPDAVDTLRIDATLPRSPTQLESIVVRGERVALANPGLIGFYERRDKGYGSFLTGDEIDRTGGWDLSNHLRRLRIHFGRDRDDPLFVDGALTRNPCIVTYLDGTRVRDLSTINEWVPASQLGGIEAYRQEEFAHIPGGFLAVPPQGCIRTERIVMFWSKVLREPSPFEVGAHLGVQFVRNGDKARYVGAQFITPVRSGSNTLRLHLDVSGRLGGQGRKWRALLNFAFRPFGHNSPLYIGSGVGLTKSDRAATRRPGDDLSTHYTALIGANFGFSFLRPYLEMQALDFITPGRLAVFSQLGVRIRPTL